MDEALETQVLRTAKAQLNLQGCALLNTCERLEIWISCASGHNFDQAWKKLLDIICAAKNLPLTYAGYFDSLRGNLAITRLFETACGLRSRLKYEDQILGQVKLALAASQSAGCGCGKLNRLFQAAISCAKQVKTEVSVTQNPNLLFGCVLDELNCYFDVAKASDDLSSLTKPNLKEFRTLVIGSGKVGRQMATSFARMGSRVSMTLRSAKHHDKQPANGVEHFERIEYSQRYSMLAQCNLIIGATSSPHLTMQGEAAKAVLQDGRKRLLVDLAVPADFAPDLGIVGRTKLVNLEYLFEKYSSLAPFAPDPIERQVRKIIDKHFLGLQERYQNHQQYLPSRLYCPVRGFSSKRKEICFD